MTRIPHAPPARAGLAARLAAVAAAAGLVSALAAAAPRPALAACTDMAAPEVEWRRCRMDGAALDGVDLGRARLADTSFQRASLVGARLVEADARRARFISADLSAAVLDGADLTSADLTSARLAGASDMRVILRHLLPSFASYIIVALTLSIRVVQILWNLSGAVFVLRGGFHAPSQREIDEVDSAEPVAPAR